MISHFIQSKLQILFHNLQDPAQYSLLLLLYFIFLILPLLMPLHLISQLVIPKMAKNASHVFIAWNHISTQNLND